MKNKFKSIVAGIILAVVGVFAGVGLAGCGGNLSTLKSEYASMTKKIASYKEVFSHNTIDGIDTDLKVSYGEYADGQIRDRNENFLELEDKYNSILVISNDYIVQNIQVIQNYGQKNLSKKAKKAVKELCDNIKSFTKYLSSFATARKGFAGYFEQMGSNAKPADIESQLVTFRKSYGKLVEKNIKISMSVAKCMENTKIYDSLKNSKADGNTLKIIRDYTRTKMLPIFSKFMLTEVSNKFIWSNYKNKSDTLREIDALLNLCSDTYAGDFKRSLVSNGTPTNLDVNVKDLFDLVDEFLKEANSYKTALGDFGIKDFAVSYDGNMKTYLKQNKLAERDLYKMDQFLKITLPNFIRNFSDMIR